MPNDKRSRKIALIAHCILNQNSRAFGLAERPNIIIEIVELLVQKGIGIVQMPCPEIDYAGVLRQPKTKNQYANASFRSKCRKMAEEIASQIQAYEHKGIKLMIVIGVDGSPSCGVAENTGIFFEELRNALHKRGVHAPFYGIRYERLSTDITNIQRLIK